MTTEATGEGVLVFELNALDALPAAPSPAHLLSADAVWAEGGYESSHNLFVNQESGYGYLVGVHLEDGDNACGDADPTKRFNTLVIDLAADPFDPPVVACLENTGEHDIYVVNYNGPDKEYTNHEIAFVFDGRERDANGNTSIAVGNGGLTEIWDVTDKSNIQVLSSFNVPGVCFSHQGWTTKNHEFLLINDEITDSGWNGWCPNVAGFANAGLFVVDVTDLDNPVFAKRFELGVFGNAHNFMRVNRHLYWAAYSAGARVLELKRTKKGGMLDLELTEVAHMDTEPRDYPHYFGLWGLFAFERSDTILGSDMVNGLVIMRMD
jgi:choice-of-anchor B domain-containing protein